MYILNTVTKRAHAKGKHNTGCRAEEIKKSNRKTSATIPSGYQRCAKCLPQGER